MAPYRLVAGGRALPDPPRVEAVAGRADARADVARAPTGCLEVAVSVDAAGPLPVPPRDTGGEPESSSA